MRQASCSFQAAQSGALGMLQCLLAGGGDQQARGAAACSLCSCVRAGVVAAAAAAAAGAAELESKLLQHQASDQRETITSFPRPHRHGQSL